MNWLPGAQAATDYYYDYHGTSICFEFPVFRSARLFHGMLRGWCLGCDRTDSTKLDGSRPGRLLTGAAGETTPAHRRRRPLRHSGDRSALLSAYLPAVPPETPITPASRIERCARSAATSFANACTVRPGYGLEAPIPGRSTEISRSPAARAARW